MQEIGLVDRCVCATKRWAAWIKGGGANLFMPGNVRAGAQRVIRTKQEHKSGRQKKKRRGWGDDGEEERQQGSGGREANLSQAGGRASSWTHTPTAGMCPNIPTGGLLNDPSSPHQSGTIVGLRAEKQTNWKQQRATVPVVAPPLWSQLTSHVTSGGFFWPECNRCFADDGLFLMSKSRKKFLMNKLWFKIKQKNSINWKTTLENPKHWKTRTKKSKWRI